MLRSSKSLILMVLAFAFVSNIANAQEVKAHRKTILEFGLGAADFKSGDMMIKKGSLSYSGNIMIFKGFIGLKTEVGTRWINDINFNFGHNHVERYYGGVPIVNTPDRDWGFYRDNNTVTTFHIDHNIYYRPIKTAKLDFNIGCGYSLFYVSDIFDRVKDDYYQNTTFQTRTSVGGNLLAEARYKLNPKNSISLCLSTQHYLSGDAMIGGLIKFGRVL